MKPKRVLLFTIIIVLACVTMVLMPLSSSSHNTLNCVQVVYYRTRANCGDDSAIIPLCYHYVFGENSDINKGIFWVDKLSKSRNELYASRSQVFRLGIENLKEKEDAD